MHDLSVLAPSFLMEVIQKSALHAVKLALGYLLRTLSVWIVSFWYILYILSGQYKMINEFLESLPYLKCILLLRHGTRVAGIIAASKNGKGIIGIAFGAQIAGI